MNEFSPFWQQQLHLKYIIHLRLSKMHCSITACSFASIPFINNYTLIYLYLSIHYILLIRKCTRRFSHFWIEQQRLCSSVTGSTCTPRLLFTIRSTLAVIYTYIVRYWYIAHDVHTSTLVLSSETIHNLFLTGSLGHTNQYTPLWWHFFLGGY